MKDSVFLSTDVMALHFSVHPQAHPKGTAICLLQEMFIILCILCSIIKECISCLNRYRHLAFFTIGCSFTNCNQLILLRPTSLPQSKEMKGRGGKFRISLNSYRLSTFLIVYAKALLLIRVFKYCLLINWTVKYWVFHGITFWSSSGSVWYLCYLS